MRLEERSEIIRQLQLSEGQVRAVAAMIETGQPCVKIMRRLASIREALAEISAWLITCEVERSREIILHAPASEQKSAEWMRLGDLYEIMTQFSIPYGEYPNE